ncbi:MAG: S8 family peptidase, partial [Planctomycetia bacterium]
MQRRFRFEPLEERDVPAVGLAEAVLRPTTASATADGSVGAAASLIGYTDPVRNLGLTGARATVAVVDTGVDYRHAALGGGWGRRVVAGYDFVDDDRDPMDENGHGTHVAGIIASNDSTHRGLAPDVDIVALRVLDENGDGQISDIEKALKWIVRNQRKYNIVAVNLSLGFGSFNTNPGDILDDELSRLRNRQVFVAASAGNDFFTNRSQPGVTYPAASRNVVSVGAVYDQSYGRVRWRSGAVDFSSAPDRLLSFSQRGGKLDIVAPGSFIESTNLGGGFRSLSGTSMASPMVVGAAVVVRQALQQTGRSPRVTNVLAILRNTGVRVFDGDD